MVNPFLPGHSCTIPQEERIAKTGMGWKIQT